jgi:CHAT domain-containing protein
MTFKSKIVFCFFLVSLGFNSYSLFAQTKQSKNIIKQLRELYYLDKPDSVVSLSGKALQGLNSKTPKDSLLIAKLYLYEYMGLHKTNKSIHNISSILKGISYCPQSNTGDSLKAVFYNKKAYLENELGSTMKSLKSIRSSLKLSEETTNPNPGSIMGAYLLLSNQNAYYGNFDHARHYMRLAEDVYAKNKTLIDNNTWELNGNYHRLGVIAKYRKIYMLWKLSKDSKDSLMLLNTMNDLEKMHGQLDFHKEERIYYSTALNHVGDWLISHNHDSLTTSKDVSLGLNYLLKALHLTEEKKYPGTPWAIKYNIAKGFIIGNQLEIADSTMAVLFNVISETDGRLPFFLAQKALIKAKKNEKDSALIYFHKSIQKVHRGKDSLKANYNNFKPSKSYNHTRLLLRVSEELNNYYPKDSIVQKKIAKLFYLALQQFENSYLDVSFNSKQNKQLRQIIQGILKMNRTGYYDNNLLKKTLLNKFEIFKNQMAWKKFYESRYTSILPELDSVKQRKLELATLLNKAKISNNIPQGDSIQTLIYKHESYKKKSFPQLELLSDFEFSVENLQRDLTPKDLILKYILLENEIAIYQISKTEFNVRLLPWTKKEKDKLSDFIEKTRLRNYDLELGSQLGQLLLPSIDKDVTNLIINPDGILFKLPFEVLQVEGKFAAEFYNFRYTSNLGFINYASDKASLSEDIHIYAPSYTNTMTQSDVRDKVSFLKGASNEAKSISKLFPSKLFNDESLTKSEFIKTAGKAKLLHLAMHAEVNNDYPELSRLLFSKSLEKEEDHLYLEELYGLSLSAELAILSSCNTGAGLEKNGSLESFQRAFTFAGVPATVASLWEVPDSSTEQIMVSFYKNLKAGQTKSEALRNAKLSFRDKNANNKLSAPYFWAGFVVYGSDTPIADEPSSLLFYIIATTAIIIIIVILYRRRKAKLTTYADAS